MKRILFIINTYKRSESLLRLLNQIIEQSADYSIQLLIIEDLSNENYEKCRILLADSSLEFTWLKTTKHYSKAGYWQIIDKIYHEAENIEFDYLFHLPDDVGLCDDFISKAISRFDSIIDPRKICLNLLREIGRSNPGWTNHTEKKLGEVINTGWVDMCFVATDRYLKVLKHTIMPVDKVWSNDPAKSSGVGMQISRRLTSKGYNIYQVKKSLVEHGVHASVMHPKERKINPLITNHMKITATMATMPCRLKSLKQTVASIINQVDEIHIYLNEFNDIPGFLRDKRIKIYRSQNEVGDIGDAGKFYKCENIEGYHFTIDDDLVYPVDYVKQMVAAIEKYNQKYIITCHGRILAEEKIKSYYHNFKECVSCLGGQLKDKLIHIGGTGVMAYYTGTIKLKFSDFRAANMADIWLALVAKKQKVNILAMAHKTGWIKEGNYDREYTIYNFCNNKDAYQTEIVNSVEWNQLPVL
jgi:hypothetical protein